MARSHAIYVVKDALSGAVMAAFTVKHELKTWLNRLNLIDYVVVYRCDDGLPCGINIVPDSDLKE